MKTALLKAILVPLALALVLTATFAISSVVRAPEATSTQIAADSGATQATDATTLALKKYKMSTVRKHNTAASCWTVVGTYVYNLTKWIPRHPGGKARIVALCGKKGTSKFHGAHGTGGKANRVLKTYRIGKLA